MEYVRINMVLDLFVNERLQNVGIGDEWEKIDVFNGGNKIEFFESFSEVYDKELVDSLVKVINESD